MFQYDVANINRLLESFYKLTKIRVVMFDSDFQKIAEHPNHDCEFCTLIKSDSNAASKCLESDRFALLKCKSSGEIFENICHTGLAEIAAPIKCGNINIGYLMFGQVANQKDKQKHWESIKENCKNYSIDLAGLEQSFLKRRYVNNEQLVAASQLLEACAGYLWLKRYVGLKENTIANELNEYIISNLDADLSVTALTENFGLSRTKLYRIVKEVYGKGIEQLTRELRINKAKELLRESDMSVSEVALSIGFCDYNYFIKVFKKETGFTPAKFRKSK